MMASPWFPIALSAMVTAALTQLATWLINRKSQSADAALKDAEATHTDLESARDVAQLRLEDATIARSERDEMRIRVDAMDERSRKQDAECAARIAILEAEVKHWAARYLRLDAEHDDLKRQMNEMRRGLHQAGGSPA